MSTKRGFTLKWLVQPTDKPGFYEKLVPERIEMCHAVANNDARQVQSLIAAGVPCQFPLVTHCFDEHYEGTLLHLAALTKSEEAALVLVGEGALDQEDWKGKRALHYAAASNLPRLLTTMVERGCDPGLVVPGVSSRDPWMTPMLIAIRSQRAEAVEALIRVGDDVNRFDNVNCPGSTNDEPGKFMTPLQYIASTGKADARILRALLDAGADPYHSDHKGRVVCALMEYSAMSTLPPMYECGIDLNRAGADGLTPLDHALNNVLYQAKCMGLIALGADTTGREDQIRRHNHGLDPLVHCVDLGNPQLVLWALERGCDPSKTMDSGESILDYCERTDARLAALMRSYMAREAMSAIAHSLAEPTL